MESTTPNLDKLGTLINLNDHRKKPEPKQEQVGDNTIGSMFHLKALLTSIMCIEPLPFEMHLYILNGPDVDIPDNCWCNERKVAEVTLGGYIYVEDMFDTYFIAVDDGYPDDDYEDYEKNARYKIPYKSIFTVVDHQSGLLLTLKGAVQ